MSIDVYITQGTPQDVRARYNSLKELAATLDFGYLDDEVVVLDTETTGLSFKKEELTQIAAARMKKGKITDWFVTFVNPGKPIPANITDLTKITNDDVRDAPTPDFARAKLVEFVGDCPIVAHNAPFDFNFCTKDEAGGPLKNNLWIDSLDIARIALVRLNSFRLKELALAFDAPPSTHRADADVESLCAVYRYLLAAVFAMPPDLVEKISQLEDKEVWPTGEVFRVISQLQKAHFEAQQDVTLSPDASIPFNLKALRRRRIHEVEKRTVAHTIVDDTDTGMHDIEGFVPSQSVFGAGKTKQPPLSMPLPEEISDEFSPEGILGKMYDNYERREEQVAMANHVLQAFSTEQNLVIEAGTGVGKSMAYLLPSAFIAMRNNVKVGVATKTNSLLDQLIYKELPALAAALKSTTGQDLRFASLKGFTHYPCLRKIDRIVMDELRMVQVNGELLSQAPVVAQLLSFIEQSEYDDLDAVPLHRHILPRYSITSDSRECMRKNCPFYNKICFTHGKREQEKYAHIVVTNHSLFFIVASSPGPLLPKAPFWIVDEAHGAEDAARKATAQRFSAYEAKRVADALMSEDARRNPFVSLLRSNAVDQSKQPEAASLYFGLLNKVIHEGKTFASTTMKFLDAVKNLSTFVLGAHAQYDKEEILITNELIQTYEFSRVQKTYDEFALNGQDFAKHAGELLAFLEGFENINSFINEIALLVSHASTLLDAAKLVLEKHDSEYIRSFTAT
ncbi:MAG: DNA polymerase III subunit epsilon, partial [Eggerthellaceae bacterium]|nr:DNA polymerase III subunit epsilon [Eggerthellaceae bacterium]